MAQKPTFSIRVFWFMRIAVAALVLSAISCTEPTTPVRVLIVGDSISTSGTRGISGDEPGLTYADRLTQNLGDDFDVTNASCAGSSSLDWTFDAVDRQCPFVNLPNNFSPNGLLQDRALPALPVDIAVVLFGTNDSVGFREPNFTPVQPDDYGAAIDEIATALLSRGAKTVLLMTPPKFNTNRPTNPNFDHPNKFLARYREKILSRCEVGDGVVCGPDLYELLDVTTDFATNDVHPNARGHKKIETALYPFITTGR